MIAKGAYVARFARGRRGRKPVPAAVYLTHHLKYMQYRKASTQESHTDRLFFSKEREHISRQEVHADIMAHAAPNVSYHKIILSPAEDEPVTDWQQWTRDVLRDLEAYQEKRLHWYAVMHRNTPHPHVHVILAGQGEDASGTPSTVTLYTRRKGQPEGSRDDYGHLIQSGREHSSYAHCQQIARTLAEIDAQDEISHQRAREEEPLFLP